MTSNPLHAVSTEDLILMRKKAYQNLKAACDWSDAVDLPRKLSKTIADITAEFIRYDDELEARGK